MKTKSILSLTLAFLLILTASIVVFPTEANASGSFSDLPKNHWAYGSIKVMQNKQIINGYPDGTFRPSQTVTYGEFLKMAITALDGKDDVAEVASPTHWASKYYKAALNRNLFDQGQIPEKVLNLPIPRQDMALVAANAISAGEVNDKEKVMSMIDDVDRTTVNYQEVLKAYSEGLITGYPNGTFQPMGTLSRAEASAVIYRIIDKSARIIPEGISSVPSKPKEDTSVNVSGSEYKTDYRGTYKTVKFSDYVKSGITDSMKEQYYFPEELRVYNEGDLNVSRIYVSWEEAKERIANGTTTNKEPWQTYAITGEVAYKCFVVKNGEIIQDTEMGTISGANSVKEDWTTTHILRICSPTDFDYLLFVEEIHTAEWLINGETFKLKSKGDEIPRLYPNPFK